MKLFRGEKGSVITYVEELDYWEYFHHMDDGNILTAKVKVKYYKNGLR